MNWISVLYAVGWIIMIIGGAIFSAVPAGWIMGDDAAYLIRMAYAGLIPVLVGLLLILLTVRRERSYAIREGFGIVAIGWVAAGLFGALPYFAVEHFYFYDAIFETMSGFSTTGATVISPDMLLREEAQLPNGIESVSYTILFYRSLTQWLGGMGFVVLCIAILPFLGLGAQFLFTAESTTGSGSHQLATRIASASKLLWGAYVIFTFILMILLKTAGLNWFDALNHALTCMATGGFSTKQASIAAFDSAAVNAILVFFMILAASNFILHARALRGQVFVYAADEEFRSFIFMIFGVSFICMAAVLLAQQPMMLVDGITIPATLENAANHCIFTVVSLITSTGFTTVDFTAWPVPTILPLLLVMLVCGCSGSTSGGLKQVRLILVVKQAIGQVRRCLFPHAKEDVRFSGEHTDQTLVYKALGFFTFFIVFTALIAFIITVLAIQTPEVSSQMDLNTAATLSLTCMANVGPAAGAASPMHTFAWLTPAIKLLLSFVMAIGRLELFTVLVLFLPSFWRK